MQEKNPDKSSSELVFRFELVHPEMAAGSDPSTDTSARLQARVLVRNTTSHTIPIKLRAIAGHELECPLHQGKFDVRNGSGTCAPVTEDVRSYPVRIEGGRVFVQMSD